MTDIHTDQTWRDYAAMLRTSAQVGIHIIPMWKCAELMAILYTWGNNEGFTLSPKFNVEREFIQEWYHINGGELPDTYLGEQIRDWIARLERVTAEDDPEFVRCAELINDRYGFRLLL